MFFLKGNVPVFVGNNSSMHVFCESVNMCVFYDLCITEVNDISGDKKLLRHGMLSEKP